MRNPLDLIRGIFTKPATIPPQTVKDSSQVIDQLKQDPKAFSTKDIAMLKTMGIRGSALKDSLAEAIEVNWERTQIYREADKAQVFHHDLLRLRHTLSCVGKAIHAGQEWRSPGDRPC